MQGNFGKIVIGFLFISSVAYGESKLNIKKDSSSALLHLQQETETLNLSTEEPLPLKMKHSSSALGLQVGSIRGTDILIETNTTAKSYKNSQNSYVAEFDYQYFPIHWYGHWGVDAFLGYSHFSQDDEPMTVLHSLPMSLGFAYRGEWSERQWLVPWVSVGYLGTAYFQRGSEQLNTSIWRSGNILSAGLAFPLKPMGVYESRLDYELRLTYQKSNVENILFGAAIDL